MIHILPRSTIGNVWKIFVKTSRVSTRGLASQTAGHTNRSVLVYGGAGGLGSGIVDTFSDAGWDTVSADFRANTSAKLTVALTPGQNWGENARLVCGVLQENKLEPKVIVNAAGGWAGGSIDAEDVSVIDKMIEQNLMSALTCGYIASKCLSEDGLLVLTGAAAIAEGGCSSGMVGYSVAKAGVHNLIASLAEPEALGKNRKVVGLLPNVIDTPANRHAMPDADFNTWTNPHIFAKAILHWAESGEATEKFPILENGRMYTFKTLVSGMNRESVSDYIDEVETAYRYELR